MRSGCDQCCLCERSGSVSFVTLCTPLAGPDRTFSAVAERDTYTKPPAAITAAVAGRCGIVSAARGNMDGSNLTQQIIAIQRDPNLSDAEKAKKRQDLLSGKWVQPPSEGNAGAALPCCC